MRRKLLVYVALFITGFNGYSQTDKGNLTAALNKITGNAAKQAELTQFITGVLEHNGVSYYEELPYEYHGVEYSYGVKGKYLFVAEKEYGGSGSSYENTTSYIIDTESKKVIPAKNIFINLSDQSFQRLINQYLSRLNDSEMIDQQDLSRSIVDMRFSLFYDNSGVGIQWDKGSISANAFGPYQIILPFSRVQNFLTTTGKEVFK